MSSRGGFTSFSLYNDVTIRCSKPQMRSLAMFYPPLLSKVYGSIIGLHRDIRNLRTVARGFDFAIFPSLLNTMISRRKPAGRNRLGGVSSIDTADTLLGSNLDAEREHAYDKRATIDTRERKRERLDQRR